MNQLYKVMSISKQAFFQWHHRQKKSLELLSSLEHKIMNIRQIHPRLSARKMYDLLSPVGLGRDKFETYCFSLGYKVPRKRSFHRTTNSWGVRRFANLLATKELTGVNQAWVSDITYYRIAERFYYLTLIMDLHSRYIVGYSASQTLLAEDTTILSLKRALAAHSDVSGGIFHSDGGGQYYSKGFLALTRSVGLINSMGSTVYENAAAERLNGIIKNDYLSAYYPQSYADLQRGLDKAVKSYNQRPHSSLGGVSPADFRQL